MGIYIVTLLAVAIAAVSLGLSISLYRRINLLSKIVDKQQEFNNSILEATNSNTSAISALNDCCRELTTAVKALNSVLG